jgi:RNA polymerase sigma factor (sigma-70 family)
MINRTVRPYVNFRLRGEEADDLVHETLTIAVQQIRNGELRNPGALGPYLHRIARRQINALFSSKSRGRRRYVSTDPACVPAASPATPESELLRRERAALMKEGLGQLQGRDRELLTRFYLDGQTLPSICEDMQLTEAQARVAKSRAKAKLAAWANAAA